MLMLSLALLRGMSRETLAVAASALTQQPVAAAPVQKAVLQQPAPLA